MSNKAVIGLGCGDEGKGVVTEYLASQDPKNTIVVRFSGGQQAAHKVIKGDVEHVFSNLGSGTLSGCPTYWSQYCTFDPYGLAKEWHLLLDKGIVPQIYIHPDCPVTTPYDVYANRNGTEVEHGTTGTGFFRTVKRERDGVKFRVGDLFHAGTHRYSLDVIDYYDFNLEHLEEKLSMWQFDGAVRFFREALGKQIVITDKIPNYEHKIFEGSQGLMLDEHIGHMPHCTPSDITPRNAMKMADIDEAFLVTRCYQTRHGNGPMTNEAYTLDLVNTEKETNVHNEYQGKFKTTLLDLDQLNHAKIEGIDKIVSADTKINLVVTCLDQVDEPTATYHSTNWSSFGGHKKIEKFVNFVGGALKINGDLYMNDSPHSVTVRKVERQEDTFCCAGMIYDY